MNTCVSKLPPAIPIASADSETDPAIINLFVGQTRHSLDLRTGEWKQIGPAQLLQFPSVQGTTELANARETSDSYDDRARSPEGAPTSMFTFLIDYEDRISVTSRTPKLPEAGSGPKSGGRGATGDVRDYFRTEKELEEIVGRSSVKRLVRIWKQLPGTLPIRRFASRRVATGAIWKAAQELTRIKPRKTKRPKDSRNAGIGSNQIKPGSMKERIIALLSGPNGATIAQLRSETGWQQHSLRGYVSGVLKKKMGLKVQSWTNAAGERMYRIVVRPTPSV